MYEKDTLKHYGVLGMRWGQRREKLKEKEKEALIKDGKSIKKIKAAPGQTTSVYGKYRQRRNGMLYIASHIVDEYGKVKLSYFSGKYGEYYVGAGKKYIDEHINLNDYFYNTKDINIEYDVYE